MTAGTPGTGPPPGEPPTGASPIGQETGAPPPANQRPAGWASEPTGWAAPPPITEVPNAPGFAYASVLARTIAFFVDGLIIGFATAAVDIALGFGERTVRGSTTFVSVSGAPLNIAFTLLSLAYFVFFWTGGRRATLGQRIFDMQVGNAADGRPLRLDQAVRRWIGLGLFLSLFGAVPGLASSGSLAELIWFIALLVTTARSPSKQGFHDVFAKSVLVRPVGRGSSGTGMACLTVIIVLVVLFVLVIVAIVATGGEFVAIPPGGSAT